MVRTAIVVGRGSTGGDLFLVPVTSRSGDFPLKDWKSCGLNLPSSVKGLRGIPPCAQGRRAALRRGYRHSGRQPARMVGTAVKRGAVLRMTRQLWANVAWKESFPRRADPRRGQSASRSARPGKRGGRPAPAGREGFPGVPWPMRAAPPRGFSSTPPDPPDPPAS